MPFFEFLKWMFGHFFDIDPIVDDIDPIVD